MMKMNETEWREYVQKQLHRREVRHDYLLITAIRTLGVSVVVAVIVSGVVIYVWGFKDWAKMILQITLSFTLASTIIAGVIKSLEKKVGK